MVYNNNIDKTIRDVLQKMQRERAVYFSFLHTAAKFHKYNLIQQICLYLYAPPAACACATASQWAQYFHRDIQEHATEIPIFDGHEWKTVYDIQDTYSPLASNDSLLWSFDQAKDGDPFPDFLNTKATLSDKVWFLCQQRAGEQTLVDQTLLATNLAYIILQRMHCPMDVLTQTIQAIQFPLQEDVQPVLQATNQIAKPILNAVGVYVKNQEADNNEKRRELSRRLDLGRYSKQLPSARETRPISADAGHPTITSLFDNPAADVSGEIFGHGRDDDATGKSDGKDQRRKSDAMGNPGEQHSGARAGNFNQRTLPVGPKRAFQDNVKAIVLLKKLEKEEREATSSEQQILKKYVGFGGLADAFDETKEKWQDEYQELKDILNADEYRAARASVLNAHYTPTDIITNLYIGLQNMGFSQGSILEPSCGIGNFFAAMPASMYEHSKLYGVELDSLSGRLAKYLYPTADITIGGFETTSYPVNSFDLAIGNVPFGNYSVHDPAYSKENFLIHDYFLAKMMDQIRPGGLVVVITSKGTMDKQDEKVRLYLAQRGELVRALRLPNTAFKSAGTAVTADILIFQKREQPLDLSVSVPDWVHVQARNDGCFLNSYFIAHPDDVLGHLEKVSTQYGYDLACLPSPDAVLTDQLKKALSSMEVIYQAPLYASVIEKMDEKALPLETTPVRPFSYFIKDNAIYFKGAFDETLMDDLSEVKKRQLIACIQVSNAVHNVIDIQKNASAGDAEIQQAQTVLNMRYDWFVQNYGHITNNKSLKALFENDVSYPLLRALEVWDNNKFLRKSDIFTKRTITPFIVPDHADTASEALIISLQQKGQVDLPYMESLSGIQIDELIHTLEFSSIYYDVHAQKYLLADEFLSGDIYLRIEQHEQFLDQLHNQPVSLGEIEPEKMIETIKVNLAALEKVKPKALDCSEIHIELGAAWIPATDIEHFMFELLGTSYFARKNIKVEYSSFTGNWHIAGKSQDTGNPKATMTYGTSDANAYKLVELSLNLREAKIYKTIYVDGDERKVIDQEKTLLAQQKQESLKTIFSDWIWKSPERRERLTAYYNRYFNNIRPREYDGSHLIFPGMSTDITLRPHQKDAIAHTLFGGNTLLAHCVGAGKTYEMATSVMESKRLKLCKKSMVVVPKHLTEQFGSEFLQLYPDAKILVATQKDFESTHRKEFCSKIATQEWDAVILGYTQFEKIPLSVERQVMFLQTEIDEIMRGIQEAKEASSGDRFSVKQMELQRKKLVAKMEALKENHVDQTLTFEELGIDRLYVDEAHYFKNLFTPTKMQNIAGVATTDAKKTMDLYEKCQYLNELTHEKGIIFATGTPITNSMTELFTMQRYLQPSRLAAASLSYFDNWAANFGKTVTAIELSPEGKGFRSKTRFAKFYNLPELMSMFKEIADIKTADMLNLPVPEPEYITEKIAPTLEQKEMVDTLAERAERIRKDHVNPNIDNMLLITNEGRKLALDQRLINPMLPNDSSSKVNHCIHNIYSIWQQTQSQRSTQMVFCDLSTPGKGFNVYDDIKNKLLDQGIPEDEIAFIHDAKNEKQKSVLFSKVRNGNIRILLGSTAKMGTGTNVQDKLIAMHDLDVPWRPSDLEQRKGRIVRQGNENSKVKIFRYVTEQTFDAYLWQIIENKQRFIAQIMTSKSPVRSAEDIDEATLSYAEIKAIATGNPLIKEKMDLNIQLDRLKLTKSNYLSQIHQLEHKIAVTFPAEISNCKDYLSKLAQDYDIVQQHTNRENNDKILFSVTLSQQTYTERKVAGEAILTSLKKGAAQSLSGVYRGLSFQAVFEPFSQKYHLKLCGHLVYDVELGLDAAGNTLRMDNALNGILKGIDDAKQHLKQLQDNFASAQIEIKKPFPQEADLQIKTLRAKQLDVLLNVDIPSKIGVEKRVKTSQQVR